MGAYRDFIGKMREETRARYCWCLERLIFLKLAACIFRLNARSIRFIAVSATASFALTFHSETGTTNITRDTILNFEDNR